MSEYGSNKSFVLRGIDDTVYEERPVPELGPHDVLVEVKKTGICGSDVHYLCHGRIGDFVVNSPMVLGHESAGIVFKGTSFSCYISGPDRVSSYLYSRHFTFLCLLESIATVGSKVKHLKAGDRVAMEPGATCGHCEDCKHGRYQLCPDVVFAATPPYDGTLGRYYKLPGHLAYLLPDNLSFEDGAMMEPLSVGVHSVRTLGQIKANQTVAVFGAGPVGLLALAVAKALGAKRTIAVDIDQGRLDFAKSYAATDVWLPPKKNEGESMIDYSKRNSDEMKAKLGLTDRGPTSVDLIIEASGAAVCVQTGLFLVKTGGTFIQVGMGTPEVTVPITMLLVKELTVKGSFRYGPGDYELAIALVAQDKINLKPLVTHRFNFDDAVEAFKTTKAGKSADGKGVIKAIIEGPQ